MLFPSLKKIKTTTKIYNHIPLTQKAEKQIEPKIKIYNRYEKCLM